MGRKWPPEGEFGMTPEQWEEAVAMGKYIDDLLSKADHRTIGAALVIGGSRYGLELANAELEIPRLAGWTYISLDECEWALVHASSLSEVMVNVRTGSAEIEVNGELLGSIEGLLRVQGNVRIHGCEDGTEIMYKAPE